jgi:glycosyltransferase involved in cell wall biosynthesis
MRKVKVSIIIAYYNEINHVEYALKSALNQNCDFEYEIILVDDGSKTKLKKIISCQDNKIKIVRQSNQGLGAARATGVENSSGEWITFLDSDDELTSDKLRKQIDFVNEANLTKNCVIFTGTEIKYRGDMSETVSDFKWVSSGKSYDISKAILNGKMPSGASMLFHRDLYFDVGGFEKGVRRHCEMLFIAKLINHRAKFFLVPKPLYIQNISIESNRHNVSYRSESIDFILNYLDEIIIKDKNIQTQIMKFSKRRLYAMLKLYVSNGNYLYSEELIDLYHKYKFIDKKLYNLLYFLINIDKLLCGNLIKIINKAFKLYKKLISSGNVYRHKVINLFLKL